MNKRSFGTTIVVVLLAFSAFLPVLRAEAGGDKIPICHRPQGNPENTQFIEAGNIKAHTGKGHELDTIGATCDEVPATEVPPTVVVTIPPATETPASTIVATGVPPTPTQVPPTPTAVPTEVPVTVTPVGNPPSVVAVTLSCNGMMADVTATVANPAAGYSVVMYVIDSDGAAISGMAFPSLSAGATSYSQSLSVEVWPTTEVSAVAFIGGFDDMVYSVPHLCG